MSIIKENDKVFIKKTKDIIPVQEKANLYLKCKQKPIQRLFTYSFWNLNRLTIEYKTMKKQKINLGCMPKLTSLCVCVSDLSPQLTIINSRTLEHLEVSLAFTTTFKLSLYDMDCLKTLKFKTPDDDLYTLFDIIAKRYLKTRFDDLGNYQLVFPEIELILENLPKLKNVLWESCLDVRLHTSANIPENVFEQCLDALQEERKIRGNHYVTNAKQEMNELYKYVNTAKEIVEKLESFADGVETTEEDDEYELRRLNRCLYQATEYIYEFENLIDTFQYNLKNNINPIKIAICLWDLKSLSSTIWNRIDDAAYNIRLEMDGPNLEGPYLCLHDTFEEHYRILNSSFHKE